MISAEAGGKLISFNIEEGTVIDSAAIVGCVDTVQLQLKKQQLAAQIENAQARTESVLSQIDVQKEQIKTLLVEKERIERLLKDNATPTRNLDDINGKISVAESQIRSIEAQSKPLTSEIASLQKQIAQINDQISKSIIKNPMRGTVIEKYAEPYEIAAPGKSLYKIANLEYITLRAYVSEKQLANVKVGGKVKVLTDNNTDKMKETEGTVTWVSAQAEFTPKIIQTKEERVNLVYAIKIKVKNDGSFKIGMPGEVRW